jgi:hypothetical protein
MTSQTFYGLTARWAQYCGMYEIAADSDVPPQTLSPERKAAAWKTWGAKETRLRILLGLCVVEGLVSQYSGNTITGWRPINALPLPASDEAFAADNPDLWIHHMQMQQTGNLKFADLVRFLFLQGDKIPILNPSRNLFDIKIMLEILSSMVSEYKQTSPPPIGTPPHSQIVKALLSLRGQITSSHQLSMANKSICLLRWHAVCMDMLVNTARGARRMCRALSITQHIFGGEKRDEPAVDPQRWVQSSAARICLLHASQIQIIATQIPLGVAHDLYLAGSLFAAATTYSSLAMAGISKLVIPAIVDWQAVLTMSSDQGLEPPRLQITKESASTVAFIEGAYDRLPVDGCETRNLSYDMNSLRLLLRNLSLPWGVAEEMELVVKAWGSLMEKGTV